MIIFILLIYLQKAPEKSNKDNVITIIDETNDIKTLNRENLDQLTRKNSLIQSENKGKFSEKDFRGSIRDLTMNNNHQNHSFMVIIIIICLFT